MFISILKNFLKLIVLAVMLVPLTVSAGSGSETPAAGMTVVKLGSTVNGYAVFNTIESPAASAPRDCLYDVYYLDLTSPGARGLFAILLAAQATGKKIARFDWSGGGTASAPALCYVSFVALQD